MPAWYPRLANFAFPTNFVWLRDEAIARLAEGASGEIEKGKNDIDRMVIADLREPLASISGNAFVSTDHCSPTDTERYLAKRGAVYSPESAWFYLRSSRKTAEAAARGDVSCICIRPFRRMSRLREFRLFIKDGELAAASQYHLIRHFHRLERQKNHFWKRSQEFVRDIIWRMPIKTFVADIYFTSDDQILLIDLNPWGSPTDPLLLRSWERRWGEDAKLFVMDPPTRISGDVDVSF